MAVPRRNGNIEDQVKKYYEKRSEFFFSRLGATLKLETMLFY